LNFTIFEIWSSVESKTIAELAIRSLLLFGLAFAIPTRWSRSKYLQQNTEKRPTSERKCEEKVAKSNGRMDFGA
jgi:hypothetical protein